MNGYERALRTLRFEETDCVATFGGWVVSAGFFEYVTGRRFWDAPRSVAFEAYRKLELDILFQGIYLPESQEDWRKHTTEVLDGAEKFTTVEAVIDYVESLPDPLTLEEDFDFEGQLETTLDGYERIQDEIGGDIFCLPACGNVRFTWYSVFGYGSYLSTIGLYPDTMKKLFEHSAEMARLGNLVRAELVKQKKLQPFFFTGQDICGQRGPMISPEALRALYFPNLRHALQPLVDIGAKIIWHSDGYIIPLVDDLIACGISGFQGFQEETGFDVRDMASLRVGSGRKPILLAGLSVARVLPYGSVADVERDVERIVDAAGEGGGLVIGTANTAGPDCPNENLAALYRHPHACSAGAAQVSRA